jgi:hypothetical protein
MLARQQFGLRSVFDNVLDRTREQAELVGVWVAENHPAHIRSLADINPAGAQAQQALELVLTWVGLAGPAAVGLIEAPVAAVVGVAVAGAGGVRRARS